MKTVWVVPFYLTLETLRIIPKAPLFQFYNFIYIWFIYLQSWDDSSPKLGWFFHSPPIYQPFLRREMKPKTAHVKEATQAETSCESQIVSPLVTLEERSRMFNLPNSCTTRQERAHVSPSHRDRCAWGNFSSSGSYFGSFCVIQARGSWYHRNCTEK